MGIVKLGSHNYLLQCISCGEEISFRSKQIAEKYLEDEDHGWVHDPDNIYGDEGETKCESCASNDTISYKYYALP